MRVHKVHIALIQCAPEAMEDYNRWYDTDHMPEFVALPNVLMGRRYIATPDCQGWRGNLDLEGLRGDAGNMCTMYFHAREADQEDLEARDSMVERLRREDRLYSGDRQVLKSLEFAVVKGFTRVGSSLAPGAIPYIGHRAIYVVIGEIRDPSRRAEWERYFDDVHVPDILEARGIAAILRLAEISPSTAGGESMERFMLLQYLDEDPSVVLPDLRGRIDGWRERGRLMSPGAYELLFQSPYRPITPFEYGFVEAFRAT